MVTEFPLPIWFDYLATGAFAVAGTLLALRKGYDIIGVFTVALVSSTGGGLIRDGIFLQKGPPIFTTNGDYLLIILVCTLLTCLLQEPINRLRFVIATFDALGLGAYAIVGIEKALHSGLAVPAAILVGVVNAVGGGILRDVLTREEPLLFRPGQFYAFAAFLGCLVFILLRKFTVLDAYWSGIITILVTFILRLLAIRLNWRTAQLPYRGQDILERPGE